jgi:arylsulfatase A-like enzyme
MEYLNKNDYIKENENPILNLYDAEIMFVDDMIGDIVGEMKGEGIYQDTVVVISADHGEEFWEHKRWGHGYTLYNEVMKIPLILKPSKGYGIDFDDRNIDTPVSLMYIPQTIMDFLNLKGEYKNFGHDSLLDFTITSSDGGSTERKSVYSETLRAYPHLKKIRTPEYSLIYDEETEEIELYNLTKDPGELVDISEKNPEIVKELMKELLFWMDDVKKEREVYGKAEDIGLDMMTREEMRGLGYIE